jgi:hypothetical protein
MIYSAGQLIDRLHFTPDLLLHDGVLMDVFLQFRLQLTQLALKLGDLGVEVDQRLLRRKHLVDVLDAIKLRIRIRVH